MMVEAVLPTAPEAPLYDGSSRSTREISLDEVLAKIGFGRFHIRLLVVAGVGFAAAAVEIVLSAFLLTELRAAWEASEWTLALVPTSAGCGSILGELVWGPVADVYGRRPVFIGTVLITAVFGILSAFAPNIWWLVAWRGLVGFGYGGNISVDFAMFSEYLPTANRGRFLFLMQAFWPVGQLICCLLAWVVIPRFGWRYFVFACTIPTILVVFLRPFIPESPRWLLLHSFKSEATETIRKVALMNGLKPEDIGLQEGVMLTLESSALEPRAFDVRASMTALLSPALRSTTIGVVIVTIALQIAGYGTLTLMPTLLEDRGISKDTVYATMVLNSLAQFPGVLGVGAFSHYVGQLLPLKMSLPMIALAFAAFGAVTDTTSLKLCTAITCMCLEAAWALTHTYIPEVYPTELRSTAIGATSAAASIITMGVPMVFAGILSESTETSFKYALYVLVSTCLAGSIGACLFLHIETHNRDLDDRVKDVKD